MADIISSDINNNNNEEPQTTKKIVVVGAGPAGLLSCIMLLRRNLVVENAKKTKYQVILVDPGVDYGKLDEDGLKRARSWMIGLTSHGLDAVREIPDLFENYFNGLGMFLQNASVGFGKNFKMDFPLEKESIQDAGFLIDRNRVCAALSRYVNDNFTNSKTTGSSNDFVAHYNTKALFVDAENQCLIVRGTNSDSTFPEDKMVPLQYDYLVGCDGVRSVVRNGFLTNHRDFEFDIIDGFGEGKSVHIKLPKEMKPGHFMVLLQCMPNVVAFCLPENDGFYNVNFGWTHDKPCDPDLLSIDPDVVAKYVGKHFAGFDMDMDDFSKQFTEQGVSSVQYVHCNFYHSFKLNALLLGDAAHATLPNIGMGMNTALADVSALNKLLNKYDDDWEQVLPAFSEERVKEGNALSDLSVHTYSFDTAMQLEILFRQNVRRFLNKIFPEWLVEREPMMSITLHRMKLSEAYDKVTRYGYLGKSRNINQEIKRRYFERKTGMVKDHGSPFLSYHWLVAIFVAIVSYSLGQMQTAQKL